MAPPELFPVRIHSNYGSVLYHFRDKVIYWLKIAIFFIPSAFDAPITGVPSAYCIPFGMEKSDGYLATCIYSYIMH